MCYYFFMTKIIANVIAIPAFILSICFMSRTKDICRVIREDSAVYAVVLREGDLEDVKGYGSIDFGFAKQVYVGRDFDAGDINLLGEYFELTNVRSVDSLISRFGIRIISRGFVGGREILYGFSKNIPYTPKGESNIQIIFRENTAAIGIPIIFSEI